MIAARAVDPFAARIVNVCTDLDLADIRMIYGIVSVIAIGKNLDLVLFRRDRCRIGRAGFEGIALAYEHTEQSGKLPCVAALLLPALLYSSHQLVRRDRLHHSPAHPAKGAHPR